MHAFPQSRQHQIDFRVGVGVDDELPIRYLCRRAKLLFLCCGKAKPINQLLDKLSGWRSLQADLKCRDIGLIVSNQFRKLVLSYTVTKPEVMQ